MCKKVNNYFELKCSGFQWNIKINKFDISIQQIQGMMSLKLNSAKITSEFLKSVEYNCSIEDFIRLADYLDSHVNKIKQDSFHDSDVFTTYGLDFQLQALCGEVDSDNEGEFTLRIMLSIDTASDNSRVYVGAEGVVAVEQCFNFTENIRQYVQRQGCEDLSGGC